MMKHKASHTDANGHARGSFMIQKNLSRIDRGARIVAGVLLTYTGFIDTTLIGDAYLAGGLGVIGLVNLFAGLTACCPLYRLAGISTRPSTSQPET